MFLNEKIVRKIIRKNLLKENKLLLEWDVRKDSSSWKRNRDPKKWIAFFQKNAGNPPERAGGINFGKINAGNNNYRSALPVADPKWFEIMRDELGIKRLITLNKRYSDEIGKAAAAAGIQVLYLPSNDDGGEMRIGIPKTSDATEANFRKAASFLDAGNVLVHCMSGADRTSAIAARYEIEKGFDPDTALNNSFGYKSGGRKNFLSAVAYFITQGIKDEKAREKIREKYGLYPPFEPAPNASRVGLTPAPRPESQTGPASDSGSRAGSAGTNVASSSEPTSSTPVAGNKKIKEIQEIMNNTDPDSGRIEIDGTWEKGGETEKKWLKWIVSKQVRYIIDESQDNKFIKVLTKDFLETNKAKAGNISGALGLGRRLNGVYRFVKKIEKLAQKVAKDIDNTEKRKAVSIDTSIINIANAPDNASAKSANFGLPNEKTLPVFIGDKRGKRYIVRIGVDSGNMFGRPVGSKEIFKHLNETLKRRNKNVITETLERIEDLNNKKIMKIVLGNEENFNKIQMKLSDQGKENLKSIKEKFNEFYNVDVNSIDLDMLRKLKPGTENREGGMQKIVKDAINIANEKGIDPGYVFGTTLRESGPNGKISAAFNYHLVFINPFKSSFWSKCLKEAVPDGKEKIIAKRNEARNLHAKYASWKNRKKNSYYNEENNGYKIIDKFMAITPESALGVAYGKYQVLGYWLVHAFDNDPQKMWNTFKSNPSDSRFTNNALATWIDSKYSKNLGAGRVVIDAATWVGLVNQGKYYEAVSYYYGAPNKDYSDEVAASSQKFHAAAGTTCPTQKSNTNI